MQSQRIGVDLEDLRVPTKDALRLASELDLRAVELPTAQGDTAPRNLTASGCRHLQRLAESLGLHLSALTADYAGLRLTDPRTVDERVTRTCEAIDLARKLGVPLVTAAVGALTHPETREPSDIALQAIARIGEFADSRGVVYAIRPAHDGRDQIRRVMDELRCPSIGIGLDPAALVIAGVDPMRCLDVILEHTVLFHARDATAGLVDRPGRETRLGEGEVDLAGLLAALRAANFAGPCILRRIDTPTPLPDLLSARDRVQSYLAGT